MKGGMNSAIADGGSFQSCARGVEALKEAASEIHRDTGSEILPVRADVTVYDDIKNLVETTVDRFGKIAQKEVQ